MPCKIVWESDGVYRHFSGDVSIDQRRASLRAISADQRFDGLRYAITNYLDVANYEVTSETTAELAAMHIGPLFTNPRLLIAAVVDRADILNSIQEFMGYGFIKTPYRVFATMPEAREWIASLSA